MCQCACSEVYASKKGVFVNDGGLAPTVEREIPVLKAIGSNPVSLIFCPPTHSLFALTTLYAAHCTARTLLYLTLTLPFRCFFTVFVLFTTRKERL